MKGLHWTPCLNPYIIRSWTFSCCTNLSSFQSENSCTFQAHCQFLEGDMSLSKLCQLRSGASRAYSTAVGKEVVIVGCARSLNHSWIQGRTLCACSGPPWVVSEALWLRFLPRRCENHCLKIKFSTCLSAWSFGYICSPWASWLPKRSCGRGLYGGCASGSLNNSESLTHV